MKNSESTFAYIKKLLNTDKKLWLVSVLGASITAIAWYIVNLVDGVIVRDVVSMVTNAANQFSSVLILLGILLLTRLLNISGYFLNAWAAESIAGKLQLRLMERWYRQKEAYVANKSDSYVLSRIINDCGDEIAGFYFQGAGLLIIEPLLSGLLAIATISAIGIEFAVLTTFMGLISTFFVSRLAPIIKETANEALEADEDTVQTFSGLFNGINDIHALGIKSPIILDIFHSTANAAAKHKRNAWIVAKSELISKLFDFLTIIFSIGLSFLLARQGHMKFENVFIVLSMQPLILSLIGGIGPLYNYLAQISVPAKRIYDVLDEPGCEAPEALPDFSPNISSPVLQFCNVCFSYGDADLLRNISFFCKQNTITAIFGKNGVGKSTIYNLIMRFYQPLSGEILLCGVKHDSCSMDSWRKQIAIVSQSNPLMNISIRDNIALGCITSVARIDQDEIIMAAKKAKAHDFILNLPEGYETIVGSTEAKLSSGQQQRIALARAFISNALMVILDEPTGLLDIDSEKYIIESIKQLAKEKTILIITHNKLMLHEFDNIVFI